MIYIILLCYVGLNLFYMFELEIMMQRGFFLCFGSVYRFPISNMSLISSRLTKGHCLGFTGQQAPRKMSVDQFGGQE